MSHKIKLLRFAAALLLLSLLHPFAASASAHPYDVYEITCSPAERLTAEYAHQLLPETEIPFRNEITRGEFCHCLNAYLIDTDRILPPRSFCAPADVDVTTDFCSDIEYIVQGGVMGCGDDGLFHPENTLTAGTAALCLYRLETLSCERKNAQPASSLPPHDPTPEALLDKVCMLGHSNALGLYRSEKNGMDYFVLNGVTAGKYVDCGYLLLPGSLKGSYLKGLERGSYGYAYIMLGTNDVHRGPSELPVFLDSIREITENVRRMQPGTGICYLSVTPMGFSEEDTQEYHNQGYIRLYNEGLKSLSRECGADYLDLFTPLCNRDGYNRVELARTDGIHYRQPGYDLILQILLTHFPEGKEYD